MPPIAKLIRPEAHRVWHRERVFARLDALAAEGRIAWLHAPPGAGKTSLASSYAEARALRTLWYQIDERDDDPATFFHYLSGRHGAGGGRPLVPPPVGMKGASALAAARRFFEELFGSLATPCLFVLDNYHELPADSPLHDAVRLALETLPPGVRALVSSREEPPGALARLRAHGAIETLGADELRVQLDEAVQIASLRGLHPREEIERLVRLTEGWAAGVVLLLEHAEGGGHSESVGPMLFDYFAAEVFERLDTEVQEALLSVALLPRPTEAMADSLVRSSAGSQGLRDLAGAGYFTVQHPGDPCAYQFHPLFRAFLLERGRRCLDPAARDSLLRDAAQLLRDHELPEDALELLHELGDWDALAETILREVATLYVQGRFRTLERWIERIPGPELSRRPWLLHWYGAARLPGSDGSGLELLELAHRRFRENGDAFGSFWSWASIVDSILGKMDGVVELDPWIDSLQELLAEFGRVPDITLEARVTSSQLCALRFRRAGSRTLRDWMERGYRLLDRDLDEISRLLLGFRLHECEIACGEPAAARQLGSLARRALDPERLGPIAPVFASLFAAKASWTAGDAEGCLNEAHRGLEAAAEAGDLLSSPHLLSAGVHASLLLGDVGRAERFLDRFRSQVRGAGRQHLQQLEELAGEIALRRGALADAEAHLDDARELARQSGVPFYEAQCRIGLALVQWERRDRDAALDHLDAVGQFASESGSAWLGVPQKLYRAGLELERGAGAKARRHLREGLELARGSDCRVFPWWSPSRLAPLLARALDEGIESDFVRSIIRERRLPPDPAASGASWPWPLQVQTLGEFVVRIDGERLAGASQHRRPLELLQALIALGPGSVREERIADELWPDSEGDAAHRAFKTTLHRLRRLVGHEHLRMQGGELSLDARSCFVDVDALRHLSAADLPSLCVDPSLAASHLERLLQTYPGPFLPGVELPSARATRERMRSRFTRGVLTLAEGLERGGLADAAEAAFERAVEAEPLAEALYRGRIALLVARGRREEARRVFARCRELLEGELGTEPSSETAALLQTH